jgi:hypothetical protein
MSRPRLARLFDKRGLALKPGLSSLRERLWRPAFSHPTVADRAALLAGDELEALAIAAHLSGNEAALELLARIHQAHPDAGNIRRAARFARASRLLEDQQACPEHGYLLIPSGIRAVRSGEIQAQSLWESSRLHFPPGLGFRGVPISRA